MKRIMADYLLFSLPVATFSTTKRKFLKIKIFFFSIQNLTITRITALNTF